ncbi:MAG: hypothetical protein GY832_24940 [Chloroflexi bacterium]|nr:hypothetical protein [Chloroflexota bacterium]
MDKMGNRNRLWIFVGMVTTVFAITLAMIVGRRLDDEAVGVLIGIVGGVGATVLASACYLLVASFGHRGPPPQPLRTTEPSAEPVSLSQIPSLTDAETALVESEYRCGYRDGWIQAVGAMCDLMSNRQLTWQAAHAACWRHWETTLLPWMWPNRTETEIQQP